MTGQLSLFSPPRSHDGVVIQAYAPNHQERPDDLPRLLESAATMGTMVLEWFEENRARPFTPTMCADAMGLKLTTVRPRICQLAKRTQGPRLQHCAWIPRRPTEDGGSEGWYRFKEGTEA